MSRIFKLYYEHRKTGERKDTSFQVFSKSTAFRILDLIVEDQPDNSEWIPRFEEQD